MKAAFVAVTIVGLLVLLAGITFALQGEGMVGGSVMSGNPFWIYAGSGVAMVGLIILALGIWPLSRKTNTSNVATDAAPS